MLFRVASAFVVLGLAGSVLASFEMGLVVESGSNSIRRLDLENRISLGRFGGNRLITPRAVAVDQANNEAFILNFNATNSPRVTVFNYFTGEFRREFNVNAVNAFTNAISFTPGFGLLVPSTTGASLYNPSGSLVRNYSSTVTNISAATYSSFYNEIYLHSFSSGFQRYTADTGVFQQNLASPGSVGFSSGPGNFFYGADGQRLVQLNTVSLFATTLTDHTVVNSFRATAWGHTNTLYAAGAGTSGQIAIVTFDAFGNRVSDAWNISDSNGAAALAVVNAPEPGTFAAIGIGAAALLRRRRRTPKSNS